MAHTHSAENGNTYYLEQLCMIAFCGAFGVVQILLYHYKVLDIILTSKFHVWVLASGIVLTCLAVLRGVTLFVAAGKASGQQTHDHESAQDHEHEHMHDHAHEHMHGHEQGIMTAEHVHTHACDHDHDHTHGDCRHEHSHANCGHDHGWAPWRYVVLMLPIVLFLMGMPWPAEAVPEEDLEAGVMRLDFNDLQKASGTAQQRDYWQGKLVRIKGQFSPGHTDKTFGLFRLKMTCCAADAYPLNVSIVAPEPLAFEKLQGQWVNVIGKVKFERPEGRDDWVTSLHMRTNDDVQITRPDPRPFLQ